MTETAQPPNAKTALSSLLDKSSVLSRGRSISPSDSTLSRIVTGDVSDNIFGAAILAYGDSNAINLGRFRQAVTAAVRLAVKGVFASDHARGLKVERSIPTGRVKMKKGRHACKGGGLLDQASLFEILENGENPGNGPNQAKNLAM